MYHRREKKDRVYTDSEVHVCNVSEVQAEHDEKREIVLDNTVKDNQSYLILGSKKKTTQVIKSFLECLISVLRSKSFRLV